MRDTYIPDQLMDMGFFHIMAFTTAHELVEIEYSSNSVTDHNPVLPSSFTSGCPKS